MTNLFNWRRPIEKIGSDYFDNSGNLIDQYLSGTTIVLFYTPTCIHCKNIYPIFNQFGSEVKSKVAVVDVSSNPVLLTATKQWNYHLNGFPTIVKFVGGKFNKIYDGSRTVQSLKEFSSEGNGISKNENSSREQFNDKTISKEMKAYLNKWIIY